MATARDVYTFADLQNWSEVTSGLEKKPRLAVIGYPVEHSRSPQMHNPGLEALGEDGTYTRVHLREQEIPDALSLFKENDFLGFNVTIPHKGTIFDSVDEKTEVAERVGAVNTVLIEGDKLIGHNTDAPGLKRAIREEFSMDLTDLRVMIIGAGGGAGKAAAVQCAMSHCDRLVLVNRTVEKVEELAKEIRDTLIDPDKLEGPASTLVAIPWKNREIEREIDQVDLIINATSVGMTRSDPDVIPQRLLQPHHLVYDMIYAPPRTKLIADAESSGAKAANGLSMLLWQGVLAQEFWFGKEADAGAMRTGLLDSL